MEISSSVVPTRSAPGRSCIACRKRKIRCDRQQPCSYCTKLRISCTYPSGEHEEKKQPTTDILAKLSAIELSLSRLESRIQGDSGPQTPGRPLLSPLVASKVCDESQSSPIETSTIKHSNPNDKPIQKSFWANLEEDSDKTDAEDIYGSTIMPSSVISNGGYKSLENQAFIFSMSSVSLSLRQIHPHQNQIFALWQMFLDNVDPLIKMVHVPTVQRQILRASQNLDDIPPAIEGLLFSIYFAAVTSTQTDSSCQHTLGEDKQSLLERYRFGVEQALAKANFMSNPSIITLQSLVLYLICARSSADKPYVWTMTGVAIHLATKLRLQEDPVIRGFPPYISEIRRRLWWQICILDVRTAEENDMDPCICEHDFDTRFPSNVNDTDLDIAMTEPVIQSNHRTEMLFTLTRIEISYAARRVAFSQRFGRIYGYETMSQDEQNDYIDQLDQKIQNLYLSTCDMKIPMCFLVAKASRLVLAKIKLTLNYFPRSSRLPASLSPVRDITLAESSIEIIEYAHSLRSDDKYSRWTWLFQKYVEWDAMALLLCSLIVSPMPQLVERAWAAIDVFFEDWKIRVVSGDRRWKRLEKLRAQAMTAQSSTHFASVESNRNDPIQLMSDVFHSAADTPTYSQAGTTLFEPNAATLETPAPREDVDWYFDSDWNAMQASYGSGMGMDAPTSWL